MKYSLQANQGVTGLVKDKYTGEPIPNATLQIIGRDMYFHNDINGRFWRLLLPGTYNISVSIHKIGWRPINLKIKNYWNNCFLLLSIY